MILEACVESLEDAEKAAANGANRIELCSSLDVGGLTPPHSLMEQVCPKLEIPVLVMIRPRGGSFVYSGAELSQMKGEIAMAKKAGAAGVVFGLLTNKNKIDLENTLTLVKYAHAQPLQVTFHKAIDLLIDPVEGVLDLLQIDGVTRILTSGGKPTALEGFEKIREMIGVAGGKITILVAGKVTDKNIGQIHGLTGATEFHGRRIVG